MSPLYQIQHYERIQDLLSQNPMPIPFFLKPRYLMSQFTHEELTALSKQIVGEVLERIRTETDRSVHADLLRPFLNLPAIAAARVREDFEIARQQTAIASQLAKDTGAPVLAGAQQAKEPLEDRMRRLFPLLKREAAPPRTDYSAIDGIDISRKDDIVDISIDQKSFVQNYLEIGADGMIIRILNQLLATGVLPKDQKFSTTIRYMTADEATAAVKESRLPGFDATIEFSTAQCAIDYCEAQEHPHLALLDMADAAAKRGDGELKDKLEAKALYWAQKAAREGKNIFGYPRRPLQTLAERDAARIFNFSKHYGKTGAALERAIEGRVLPQDPEAVQKLYDSLAPRPTEEALEREITTGEKVLGAGLLGGAAVAGLGRLIGKSAALGAPFGTRELPQTIVYPGEEKSTQRDFEHELRLLIAKIEELLDADAFVPASHCQLEALKIYAEWMDSNHAPFIASLMATTAEGYDLDSPTLRKEIERDMRIVAADADAEIDNPMEFKEEMREFWPRVEKLDELHQMADHHMSEARYVTAASLLCRANQVLIDIGMHAPRTLQSLTAAIEFENGLDFTRANAIDEIALAMRHDYENRAMRESSTLTDRPQKWEPADQSTGVPTVDAAFKSMRESVGARVAAGAGVLSQERIKELMAAPVTSAELAMAEEAVRIVTASETSKDGDKVAAAAFKSHPVPPVRTEHIVATPFPVPASLGTSERCKTLVDSILKRANLTDRVCDQPVGGYVPDIMQKESRDPDYEVTPAGNVVDANAPDGAKKPEEAGGKDLPPSPVGTCVLYTFAEGDMPAVRVDLKDAGHVHPGLVVQASVDKITNNGKTVDLVLDIGRSTVAMRRNAVRSLDGRPGTYKERGSVDWGQPAPAPEAARIAIALRYPQVGDLVIACDANRNVERGIIGFVAHDDTLNPPVTVVPEYHAPHRPVVADVRFDQELGPNTYRFPNMPQCPSR